MPRLFFSVLLVFLVYGRASAVPPLADYAALPDVDLVTLSPSGRLMALRQTSGGSDNVVVYDLLERRYVTGVDVSEVDPRQLMFTNDEHLLLVAGSTQRSMYVRSAFDYSAAFSLDLSTGEVTRLLRRAKDLYPYQSGLGRVIGASEDGNHIYMPAYESEKNAQNPRYSVFRVELDSNRTRKVRNGSVDTIDWFVDADGRPLVREDYDNQDELHQIWVTDGNKRRLVYEHAGGLPRISPVGLTPDRQALIVAGYSDAGRRTFFKLDLDDGEMSGPILDREGKSAYRVLVDVNRVVHGVEFAGFKPEYEFFDPELNKRINSIQSRLPQTSARLQSYSANFSDLAIHVSGGWHSGASLLFRKGADEPEMIATDRETITSDFVAPTSIIQYEAGDGLTIPALVTAYDAVMEEGNAPLVVMPHGGPESHDKFHFDWLAQYFASRNYVVLQPQFRGSDGFGWDFREAGRGEWGGKMQTDLDDGVDHLVQLGKVDPDRVCIVGASYGGYAALAASVQSEGRYHCAASVNGLSDLRRMLSDRSRDFGRDHWVIRYWETLYGTDRYDKETIDALSPAKMADRVDIPVLLIHGKDDTVVPIEQSRVMHKALRRADKDVTFIQLKGEDHWLSYGDTRLAALGAISEFVERHIGAGEQ
ncbi:MAG: alpha/beta fold hydrolase [Woeseiaceae bacterium]|nr:alpha/beta fold hydrolase [Woeseiaceae bacterium]